MFSLRYSPNIRRVRVRRVVALPGLAVLAMSLNCARLPPGSGALSGKRIHVVMTFASGIEPNFYYYFLINKFGTTGTNGASGPIPVLSRNANYGYGNGYATGSQGGVAPINGVTDYGITDFVLYHQGIPVPNLGNIGLFHYTTNPNLQQYPPVSTGLTHVVLPDTSATADPSAANTLSFDIYVSQLVTDTTSATAIAQEAQNIQYLQVNIVSTNVIPSDPTSDALNKQVDAMGNTLDPSQQTAFLQIDLSQNKTYSSADSVSGLAEPANDVYPGGQTNNALDLLSWSITINPS